MSIHIKCWVQFHGVHVLLIPFYESGLASESLSHDGVPELSTFVVTGEI